VTGGTARGPFALDKGRALEALRLEWAAQYDTGFADGAYRAARIDRTGDLLTEQTPDELAAAIRADWAKWGTR
jgi:hypothetical protein